MSLDKAKSAAGRLAQLPADAAKVLKDYRAKKERVARDWHMPRSQKEQINQKLKADAVAALARLKGEHRENAEAYKAAMRLVRRAPSVNLGADETMAWERLRTTLDAAKGSGRPLSFVAKRRLDEAKADGDTPMIKAAGAMLPDYLAANGEGKREDLADWLALENGSYGEGAQAFAKGAEKGIARVNLALGLIEAEVNGTSNQGAGVVPLWDEAKFDNLGQPPDYRALEREGDAAAVEVLNETGRARGLRLED